MVFMDCLIIGRVDGVALLAELPDVPFVTLTSAAPNLVKPSPWQLGHHPCALFQCKDRHHPMRLGDAGATAWTWPGFMCEVGHCWAGSM